MRKKKGCTLRMKVMARALAERRKQIKKNEKEKKWGERKRKRVKNDKVS